MSESGARRVLPLSIRRQRQWCIRDRIDLPKGQLSGLIDAERVLKRVKGIAFTRFSSADVVRHPLVARIVDAYDAQGSVVMRAGVTTRRKPLPTDD